VRVLLWHVHGSWTTAFVQGKHTYHVPLTPDRDQWGRGRAATYPWPDSVAEVPVDKLSTVDSDVVVLQRPEEFELTQRWTGRTPGRDLPAVYVEHNTPKGGVPDTRHPMADRDDLTLVHVTPFNELFWDNGSTRTTVIEHGIPDPGQQYTGELERIAVAINEPVRRWRVTGTDLLPRFLDVAPVDVYGIGAAALAQRMPVTGYDDPPQAFLHTELARHRLYLHPMRWTSLGLSLLEAMSLGMPVLALATTDAHSAVPADAGLLSTSVDELVEAAGWLMADPTAAYRLGARARTVAQARYGLDRFLSDWDRLLIEVSRHA
jgi:glycosyltransferase involved in cell wall biosynthesis